MALFLKMEGECVGSVLGVVCAYILEDADLH